MACIDHIIKPLFWRHQSNSLNYIRTYSVLPGEWQVLNYTRNFYCVSYALSFVYVTGNIWKERRDRRYWTPRRTRYPGRVQIGFENFFSITKLSWETSKIRCSTKNVVVIGIPTRYWISFLGHKGYMSPWNMEILLSTMRAITNWFGTARELLLAVAVAKIVKTSLTLYFSVCRAFLVSVDLADRKEVWVNR